MSSLSAPAVTPLVATSVLYDSGSVATGAVIASPVLDLSNMSAIEVVVDNTAGTTLRSLTLASYLPDLATQIDTLVLRRVAWGSAASGAAYDPGRVRALVGNVPQGVPSGSHVLYDATTAVGAAPDTALPSGAWPGLVTEDADALTFWVSGGLGATTYAMTLYQVLDDDTGQILANASLGSVTGQIGGNLQGGAMGVGPGVGPSTFGAFLGVPLAVPRRVRFTGGASAGIALRVVVTARGRQPGTFAVPMVLPPGGKITLASGGTGAARVVVLGR